MPIRPIEVSTFSAIPSFVPLGVEYFTQDTADLYVGTGSSTGPAVVAVNGGGGGGTSNGVDLATAGSTPAPSPLVSGETPVGVNPNIYVQDASGNWHAAAGVDVTTSNFQKPNGVLTWSQKQYIRDTLSSTQTGKNALLSINQLLSGETDYSTQARAIWIQSSNVTGAIANFSVSNNVVTFTVGVNSVYGITAGFRVGMRIQATGMATGTYLNNIPLTVQTVTVPNGSGNQTITASDSGFTHANVGATADTGNVDQIAYAMEGLQIECDLYGAPVATGAPDGEWTSCSLQFSDSHIGVLTAPNSYSANVIRAQYYRQSGSGGWTGGNMSSTIRVLYTNNSSSDGGSSTHYGILVLPNNNATPTNISWVGMSIQPMTTRYPTSNIGLQIGNYGTNASDYAINVVGGQCLFGGNVTVSGTLSVTTWASQNQNYVLAGPGTGGAGAATFRALIGADLPVFQGDSGSGGVQGAVPAPQAGDAAAGKFLSAGGNWSVPAGSGGATAWSALTNAAGSLTLANGTYATTFNQTSAVNWLWANTTAATSGASQSAPTLQLSGQYWTGAASASDTWSIQNVVGNGTNGTSQLTISHSGTTGAASIVIPAGSSVSNSVQISGTSLGIFTAGGNFALQLGGGNALALYNNASLVCNIATSATNGVGVQAQVGSAALTGKVTSGLSGPPRGVILSNAVSFTPTSGNIAGVRVLNDATFGVGTFAPTSGTANFAALDVEPVINQAQALGNIAGVQVVSNVVTLVFNAVPTVAFTASQASLNVTAVTNVSVNGTNFTVSTATSRTTNTTPGAFTETSGSVVTLNVGTHNFAANDYVYLSGLDVSTWLNGIVAKITSVVANTSITFTDPTSHGTASGTNTVGTVVSSYLTYAKTTGNITLSSDTGTATQQATGNYTAILVNSTETAVGGTSNRLLDLQVGGVSKFAVDNTGKVVVPSTNTATSATAGSNGAVPSQVVGYLIINVNGTNVKVPYFAT